MAGQHARSTLTRREREVLDLVGQGVSNDEISRRLGIRRQTAQVHATRGIRKLVRRLRVADDEGLTSRERDVIELLRAG
jgi:DNA-binding CsgD family transcriptional regulator